MIGELRFALECDDEPAQVVTCDSAYALMLRAQEFGKVAHAGSNPGDSLWTLALRPSVGLVGYQCVLKRHYFKLLILVA